MDIKIIEEKDNGLRFLLKETITLTPMPFVEP